jgi:hypothetical protein
MYRYVLVCTGTYRYIRFCLILYRCIGFQMTSPSGFLPPTMSYVSYDVVRHARTTSYVRRTTSCWTSYIRCRTYDIQDVDVRHRTCDIVRHVHIRHRTSTCSPPHIVYNVVCRKWIYDVVCTWHTISYVYIVYDIVCTYDVVCQHTTSYVRRTMSYVFWRWLFPLF